MLSPQQKRWMSPVTPSTDGKEKNEGAAVSPSTDGKEKNKGSPVNENEMWRRLKEVGLDEETLQKKDKAALIAHITKLESELYDYQYNMGLILLERKEWTSRYEELKLSAEEAEGNFKRDKAAHLAVMAEAEKREEGLRKALGIEKQCVADLEKAIHEIRAESAEMKYLSDNKLAQAHELVAATEEKSLAADSKLHAGEALQAEANRKRADAERKLQEVEAREDELRRQRQAFKSEFEAHEGELFLERKNLQEWEKKLQEGQERLLEGQKLLNQREEYVIERNEATKQIEKELLNVKRNVEKEQLILKEKETDLRGRLAALTTREEALVKCEVTINKKEQELLVLQEKLASREHEEIRRLTDEHQAALDARKSEFEAELDKQRRAVDDELENRRNAADTKDLELKCNEEKISNTEQQLEKKTEKLREKEKELDARSKNLKEREKKYKIEEKDIENQQKKLELEREEMNNLKQVLEKFKATLEEEKQQIHKEQERLELTENERNELRIIQTNLKEEIDNLRAKEQELLKKEDALNVEKEKFEREWEILDEKAEQLRRGLEQVDDEKKRVSRWLKDEEERLKQERWMLRQQIKSDEEALRLKKEAFACSKKQEEADLLAKFQRERADLYRDIELQTSELENGIEQRQEELERHYQERELAFQKEKQKEMHYINEQKELSDKELEEMKLERQRLEREKQEIAITRQQIEREWSEMKKDIEALEIQRQKLKELRESLHKERKEFEGQLNQLKKLKDELKITEDSLQLSENPLSQANVNDREAISPGHFDVYGISQAAFRQSVSVMPCNTDEFRSEIYPGGKLASASDTPSPLAWLQKCASRLFKQSPGNGVESNIQKQDAEITASLVSERVLGVGMDPTLSGLKQIGYVVEKAKCISERGDVANTVCKPSVSGIDKHKPDGKGSLRVFKRARSMRAVVEEDKGFLEAPSAREKNESDIVKEPQLTNVVVSADGVDATLNREKAVWDTADSGEQIDEEREESLDNGKKEFYSGRKRRRQYFSQGTTVKDTGDAEIRSELTSGEKRKRQQRETPNSSPGLERSKGNRYNFRNSTISSMISTHTSSAECKENDVSHVEEQYLKKSPVSNLKEACKEHEEGLSYKLKTTPLAEEKRKVLSDGKDVLKRSQQKLLEEVEGEDYTCEITQKPSFKETDKEVWESSLHEVTMSETGELCAESDGNEDNNGARDHEFALTEQDDEEEEEPKSLKEKVWDFLTT